MGREDLTQAVEGDACAGVPGLPLGRTDAAMSQAIHSLEFMSGISIVAILIIVSVGLAIIFG